jgi:hypothetical protein
VTAASIRACRDARAAHWQLGPLPPDHGHLTLVAWTAGAESVDGGVPGEIAGVLARSWTSIARVTFPSSLTGATTIVSTSDPGTVLHAFDDPAFPWWMQGQVLLLSEADRDPPAVGEPDLRALLDEDWARRAAALQPGGVHAVVRPGVDGDVAGILALSDPFDGRMMENLEREARLAGLAWSLVSESAL